MNFRILVVSMFTLLFATAVSADEYTIAKFEGEPFGAPDDYIAAEFNDELKKANPNGLRDGRLYARQKFEDPFDDEATTYGLYEGKITPRGKAKLGKLSIEGKPYGVILRTKLYTSKDADPKQDLDRVYFDGQFIYIEGEKDVFAKIDGEIIQLKPSIEKVSYFNFTTQPSGVDIKIAGESKGKSPSKVTVVGASSVVVTLSKSGFYTKIIVVTPKPGLTVEVSELLTEKKDLENPVPAFRSKVSEVTQKGKSKELAVFRNSLKDKIANWGKESAQSIEKLMAAYPINAAQASSESAEDYTARTQTWETERKAEQTRLEASAEKYSQELQQILSDLDKKAENEMFTFKHVYIPAASIQLGRFNKADKSFEISLNGSTPEGSFTYKASFEMGDLTNAEIIEKSKQLQAVARFWAIPAANGSTPVLQKMAVYMNQKLLTEKGKPTYTNKDLNADLTAKGATYNDRLANSSSESNALLQDSEKQTKGLLQTFAEKAAPTPVAAPAPVVAAPVAPAPVVAAPVVAAPVPAPVIAEEEEEEEETVPEVANLTNTEEAAAPTEEEEMEESADDAETDIDSEFGRQDEYRKWGAYALGAIGIGTAVVGVLQHSQYGKAKLVTDKMDVEIADRLANIESKCAATTNPSVCYDVAVANSRQPGNPLNLVETQQAANVKVRDSYGLGRNLMLGLSVISIAGAVVLFTW